MQINNVLNLAFSAPGQAASPNAGRVSEGASVEGKLSGFYDIVGETGLETSSELSGLETGSLQINDPQGGIIPIPQIFGTAPISALQAAEQYIDLSNNGIIGKDTLQAAFGQGQASAGSLSIHNQILASNAPLLANAIQPTLPANEITNAPVTGDAEFDAELAALQNQLAKAGDPKQLDKAVADLVAKAGQAPAVEQSTNAEKVQQASKDYLNKLIGADEAAKQNANKAEQAAIDEQAAAAQTRVTASGVSAPAASLATLQVLSNKVGEDIKNFESKPIDASEAKFSAKLGDIQNSKLEAHIKTIEAQQVLRSPVEQIKVKIAQGVELGQDKISIRLNPAELGKVNVEMDVDKDGKTHVRIVADRSETLDSLRRDSTDLQKSLRDVGVNADSGSLQFSLNQNREGKGGSFGEHAENSEDGNIQEAVNGKYSTYIPRTDAEINLAVSEGGLNLVV